MTFTPLTKQVDTIYIVSVNTKRSSSGLRVVKFIVPTDFLKAVAPPHGIRGLLKDDPELIWLLICSTYPCGYGYDIITNSTMDLVIFGNPKTRGNFIMPC